MQIRCQLQNGFKIEANKLTGLSTAGPRRQIPQPAVGVAPRHVSSDLDVARPRPVGFPSHRGPDCRELAGATRPASLTYGHFCPTANGPNSN